MSFPACNSCVASLCIFFCPSVQRNQDKIRLGAKCFAEMYKALRSRLHSGHSVIIFFSNLTTKNEPFLVALKTSRFLFSSRAIKKMTKSQLLLHAGCTFFHVLITAISLRGCINKVLLPLLTCKYGMSLKAS